MRFEIRRVYSGDDVIGLLRMRGRRVSVLMGRDYFLELPHGGRPMPTFARLADATLELLPAEVMTAHRNVHFGEIENTPDLPLPEIANPALPDQDEILALSAWLRSGAPT